MFLEDLSEIGKIKINSLKFNRIWNHCLLGVQCVLSKVFSCVLMNQNCLTELSQNLCIHNEKTEIGESDTHRKY